MKKSVLAVLLGCILCSCDSDPSAILSPSGSAAGTNNGGNQQPSGTLAQKQAVLDAFDRYLESSTEPDPQKRIAGLNATVAGLPGVARTSVGDGVFTLYFDDGEPLAYVQNRLSNDAAYQAPPGLNATYSDPTVIPALPKVAKEEEQSAPSPPPDEEPRRPRVDGGPTELPSNAKAAVFNLLVGDNFKPATPQVRSLLEGGNYTVTQLTGTIEEWKSMGSYAVVYMDGHGAIFPKDTSIQTSANVTNKVKESFMGLETADRIPVLNGHPNLEQEQHSPYAADLKPGADGSPPPLVRMAVQESLFGKGYHYGITRTWVTKYLKSRPFPDNSMVFTNACLTQAEESQPFIQALQDANLYLFVGWTNKVEDHDAHSRSRLFMDRLLGANTNVPIAFGANFAPFGAFLENPKQRPFSYAPVLAWMDTLPQTFSPTSVTPTRLVASAPAGKQGVGILAPSIQFTNRSPGHLTMTGTFGSRQGSVKLSGTALQVVQWESGFIDCQLPSPTFGGKLQVVVDGRGSNIVPLTDWNVPIKHVFQVLAKAGDAGQLAAQYDLVAHFVADVHGARLVPAGPVSTPRLDAPLEPDSTAAFAANGTLTFGVGNGDYSAFFSPTAALPAPTFYGAGEGVPNAPFVWNGSTDGTIGNFELSTSGVAKNELKEVFVGTPFLSPQTNFFNAGFGIVKMGLALNPTTYQFPAFTLTQSGYNGSGFFFPLVSQQPNTNTTITGQATVPGFAPGPNTSH